MDIVLLVRYASRLAFKLFTAYIQINFNCNSRIQAPPGMKVDYSEVIKDAEIQARDWSHGRHLDIVFKFGNFQ